MFKVINLQPMQGKSVDTLIPEGAVSPDAMAGPTPVSALIHAATMVTAGVYLVARMSSVYLHAPEASALMAVVGVATAFFAATRRGRPGQACDPRARGYRSERVRSDGDPGQHRVGALLDVLTTRHAGALAQ